MGRSEAGAVMGVTEAKIAFVGRLISWRWRAGLEPAALAVGRGFGGEIIYIPVNLYLPRQPLLLCLT